MLDQLVFLKPLSQLNGPRFTPPATAVGTFMACMDQMPLFGGIIDWPRRNRPQHGAIGLKAGLVPSWCMLATSALALASSADQVVEAPVQQQ